MAATGANVAKCGRTSEISRIDSVAARAPICAHKTLSMPSLCRQRQDYGQRMNINVPTQVDCGCDKALSRLVEDPRSSLSLYVVQFCHNSFVVFFDPYVAR